VPSGLKTPGVEQAAPRRTACGRPCGNPRHVTQACGAPVGKISNFSHFELLTFISDPTQTDRPLLRFGATNQAIDMATIEKAPAQYKQPSRKGKKAWRKNVDVTQVQDGLEEVRDQIIQG
jgi:hypothetical protein